MILRRLSQSLKDQNWTAIWIEFVLLIAGVYLGIQAANWNQARSEQQRTTLLLDGFRADMQDYNAVVRKFTKHATQGLAAFDAARAQGEQPAPYVMRFRGSDMAPGSVWDVAQSSGLSDLVHPRLMFEIGYFYSEVDGIGVKFVRYSEFVESEILPWADEPTHFYETSGKLKPEFQQNMDRLREWAADAAVTAASAECLIKRFEAPRSAGPTCRVDYGDFIGKEIEP